MKKIIAIVGPTASGKTQLSIQLAQYLQAEIINLDSRQIYLDFHIATAKPTRHQLMQAQHHLVDFLSPYENFTAKDIQIQADNIIQQASCPIILSGGTGLYFQAIAHELDILPNIPNEIRENIQKNYELLGIQFLLDELKSKDPNVLNHIDSRNPRRLSRALEVFMTSGKSILEFWNQKNKNPKYEFLWIGLDLGWQKLEKNIQSRIEKMFCEGLIEETQNLMQMYPLHLKAFEAIGYYEVIDYFKGVRTLQETHEMIFRKTRQYAKRQLTWFKKNKQIIWLNDIDFQEVKKLSEKFLLM